MTEERTKEQWEINFFDEYGVWPITDADVPEDQKIILSEEQITETERAVLRRNAKAYLKETDWYVSRYSETGTEIPEDILTKRAQARIDASEE